MLSTYKTSPAIDWDGAWVVEVEAQLGEWMGMGSWKGGVEMRVAVPTDGGLSVIASAPPLLRFGSPQEVTDEDDEPHDARGRRLHALL